MTRVTGPRRLKAPKTMVNYRYAGCEVLFLALAAACTPSAAFAAFSGTSPVAAGLLRATAGQSRCRHALPALRMAGARDGRPMTRRDGLQRAALAAAAWVSTRVNADAGTLTAEAPAAPDSGVVSPERVFCDDAVSRMVNAETGQEVYIVGTAHISALSAELVRNTIRLVKPDRVMVELDSQRVKKRQPPAGGAASAKDEGANPPPSSIWELLRAEWGKPVGLSEKLANVEAGIIGLAISSLYKKLDRMGFSSGQEFLTAIREAEASGATLVLGDRPVDVTLKRLQQSIEKTGLKEVTAFATSQAESPEEKLLASKIGARDADMTGSDAQQLANTVEALKERKNVRRIMGSLQASLPEVYQALIGERDVFMTSSILKAGGQRAVAVVGMAHMDGIETALSSKGYTPAPVSVSCGL